MSFARLTFTHRLSVALTATLDGALRASLLDLGGGLFAPALGDKFEILTAASGVVGAFATQSLPPLAAFLDWSVIYGANSVLLAIVLDRLTQAMGQPDRTRTGRWYQHGPAALLLRLAGRDKKIDYKGVNA